MKTIAKFRFVLSKLQKERQTYEIRNTHELRRTYKARNVNLKKGMMLNS
ncbi:MAG: hypothetical protein IPO21_17805 [Bacteroidales bacterium]|nr:hypothetical protein [Bacteroidales bacterium]